jgi:hypothetical protein
MHDRLFSHPDFAVSAVVYRVGEPAGVEVQAILTRRRAEYEGSGGLAVGWQTTAEVRRSELDAVKRYDRLTASGATYEIRDVPELDADGVWRLGLVELTQ